ncbi:uncharacterized protein [Gossypium hirsutum]|uniref:Reverse transcriptase domain-containing protein n=1 Tax=Gossypium hirsutum TaxID=3635 RepID=A0ABM3AWF3_GOSHI|nr:uncharacterized protein LOC121222443 [Gossypium hirsutum]
MGFAVEWVRLIMNCVSTTSYAVNINGGIGMIFSPTRSLRQGDPLSPFLFLICSEGLSSLMRLASKARMIKGAKASRSGPKITHLLFADDCILFGEDSDRGASILKNILKEYGECSGQCVNFNKSSIFFSMNTFEEKKEEASTNLGVRISTNIERYLGLSNMVGRRKKESFQQLKEKIFTRIEGWSTRWLSQCGKEIFIKSVLQAILTYAMSCFLLPKTLEILKTYLLCSGGRKRITEEYTWKSIWATKGVLAEGLCWRVGKGTNISISRDNWIPVLPRVILPVMNSNLNDSKVAELIDSNSRTWKKELIEHTFPEDVTEMILSISLAEKPHEDFQVWSVEASGEFTVRSSYKLLQNIAYDPRAYALQIDYKDFYRKLWLLDIPSKIKITVWKISWNFLATRANMLLRRLTSTSVCPRCGFGSESMEHLFRECPVTISVWRELSFLRYVQDNQMGFQQWLTWVFSQCSASYRRIFRVAVWAIWGDRNNRLHNK